MARLSTRGLVVIALILSVVMAALVYSYLNNLAARTVVKEGVPVVVAKVDIPPKTRVTAEMVRISMVPAEYLQPGAMVELTKVVGVIAREQVLTGEQVTQRRLLLEAKSAGLSGLIPRDKRAVSVAVTEVSGVAGLVKPGDYVDVIVTFDTNTVGEHVSQIFLQNIRVLAANRETEAVTGESGKKEASKMMTVTLAVSPAEATRLAVADEKGKIRLAMRPYIPEDGIVQVSAMKPHDIVNVPAPPPPSASVAPGQPAGPPAKGILLIRGTKAETIPVQ